ncbi:phage portal protein [Paenisporosarcina sp. NPDC076898]|uniref:phage portal protein n=1 Tax=unclassified Paenisporosarcina TaxID=2642018 RepID=UPI003D06DF9B
MSLIEVGKTFPPENHIERIAKYHRMKAYFNGNHADIYDRMHRLLKDSPQKPQLETLYIAVNLPYILSLKPADLLIGDRPTYDSGEKDDSQEQKALNSYVEENDLNTLIYESATSGSYRGDSFLKVRFGKREDTTELAKYGLTSVGRSEAIIEHAAADMVFPEVVEGNVKKFKAFNVCVIEWVDEGKKEVPYLIVEKHLPGYIINERYRMKEIPETVNNQYGYPISTYLIEEKVDTGLDKDVVKTGAKHPLVFHIPYSSVDDDWKGKGFIETVEHALQALEDRLAQLDYVLLKHTDPLLYGPELSGVAGTPSATQFGGKYIPLGKDDVQPGAVTWDSQMEGAFKEIGFLVSYIFQMSETPQWLFGTTISDGNAGGTGTSHSDGTAIKARFMPILSKVKRIRNGFDKAVRDALWACFQLDKAHGTYTGKDIYPKIYWKDGIPKNEKEEAEIMAIRTGDKPTLDQKTAIKRQDELDDMQADEILKRIAEDEMRYEPVSSNVFNE